MRTYHLYLYGKLLCITPDIMYSHRWMWVWGASRNGRTATMVWADK